MNTVNTDVINFIQSIGCGEFGKDLWFARVPNSMKTKSQLWWIVPTAATTTKHNVSGEDTIQYRYDLYYRCQSTEELSDKLFKASQELVGSHCYTLNNYRTLDIKYISTDQRTMIDEEDRVYGSVAFTVTVYDILTPNNNTENKGDSN